MSNNLQDADRERQSQERLKRLLERGADLPAWMKAECATTPTVSSDKTDDFTTEADPADATQK